MSRRREAGEADMRAAATEAQASNRGAGALSRRRRAWKASMEGERGGADSVEAGAWRASVEDERGGRAWRASVEAGALTAKAEDLLVAGARVDGEERASVGFVGHRHEHEWRHRLEQVSCAILVERRLRPLESLGHPRQTGLRRANKYKEREVGCVRGGRVLRNLCCQLPHDGALIGPDGDGASGNHAPGSVFRGRCGTSTLLQ